MASSIGGTSGENCSGLYWKCGRYRMSVRELTSEEMLLVAGGMEGNGGDQAGIGSNGSGDGQGNGASSNGGTDSGMGTSPGGGYGFGIATSTEDNAGMAVASNALAIGVGAVVTGVTVGAAKGALDAAKAGTSLMAGALDDAKTGGILGDIGAAANFAVNPQSMFIQADLVGIGNSITREVGRVMTPDPVSV